MLNYILSITIIYNQIGEKKHKLKLILGILIFVGESDYEIRNI
jgi:hypothetical protein